MKRQSVQLADGRTIQFSLKQRAGEPSYFVCFRGKDGRRLERSTKQASQKRASDSAIAIIKEEYTASPVLASLTWDEAEQLALAAATLSRACGKNGLRKTADDVLRDLEFPSGREGPRRQWQNKGLEDSLRLLIEQLPR